MTIEELKDKIEYKNIGDESFIFVYKENKFLVNQYTENIAKIRQHYIEYISTLDNINLFNIEDDVTKVYYIDEFNSDVSNLKNYIIITQKSSNEDAIYFPKIENWQISDYVKSVCSGVDNVFLDKLIKNYTDLFDLQNQMDKISIFDEKIRQTIVQNFLFDNVFDKINNIDLFDFINAICTHNYDIIKVYLKNNNVDVMQLIGLLYRQFKNMINVCLSKNPTEQSTGLKLNQIYAIKKVGQNFSKQQIFNIYKFLSSLDYKIKSGYISQNYLLDYIIVNILNM